MSTSAQAAKGWLRASSQQWTGILREREEQVFLALTLVIGALVGLSVVAFILLTERFGARLYPAGGMGLRRLLVPVAGSLGMGYLLYRYFPDARGSGVPQTKAALYAREGNISLGTVIGKFFCTSRSQVGHRSDAKARRSRLARESLLFWVDGLGFVRKE